jgi:hypothetical protein
MEKNKKIDDVVLKLLSTVKEKQAEIKKLERPNWETSCTIGYDEASPNRINIQVETNQTILVNIYSFLDSREHYFDKACEELGKDNLKFKWMGFPVRSWKNDIKLRISQLEIKAKRLELDTLEERINQLVSPEQRREIELEKLQAAIKDL